MSRFPTAQEHHRLYCSCGGFNQMDVDAVTEMRRIVTRGEVMVDKANQETMDGSPAHVTRTLGDLFGTGKFHSQGLAEGTATEVIAIRFQAGPIGEVGINGCSIEDVVDVLLERLQGYQAGPFRCRENALAITKLEEAKLWLLERTRKRQAQGVEGTNAPHKG